MLNNFIKYYGFYFLGKLLIYRTHNYNMLKNYSMFHIVNLLLLYESNLTSRIFKLKKINYIKKINKRNTIRKYFIKMFSPLISIHEIHRINTLRQLWCKSFKGKCHVVGKPVHGQNNWSNGWGSYKSNQIVRGFLTTQKRKRNKKRLFLKISKNKHKKKLNMFSVPKPVKKKQINKKPVKRKKFDVWS